MGITLILYPGKKPNIFGYSNPSLIYMYTCTCAYLRLDWYTIHVYYFIFMGLNFRELLFPKKCWISQLAWLTNQAILTSLELAFYITCSTLLKFEFVIHVTMPPFQLEAWVHGYHIYKITWDTSLHKELVCTREPSNLCIWFTIAVVNISWTSS